MSAQFPEIGRHLQLASANLNWFVYSSLDVGLFLIFAIVAFTLITILIFQLPKYLLDKSENGENDEDVLKEKEQ